MIYKNNCLIFGPLHKKNCQLGPFRATEGTKMNKYLWKQICNDHFWNFNHNFKNGHEISLYLVYILPTYKFVFSLYSRGSSMPFWYNSLWHSILATPKAQKGHLILCVSQNALCPRWKSLNYNSTILNIWRVSYQE